MEQLRLQKYKTLRIVIGMVNDKDISAVLALLPIEAIYYFTQASIERALSPDLLRNQAESVGLSGKAYLSVEQAIKSAIADAETDDLVFVGGSNFIVGEALIYFRN